MTTDQMQVKSNTLGTTLKVLTALQAKGWTTASGGDLIYRWSFPLRSFQGESDACPTVYLVLSTRSHVVIDVRAVGRTSVTADHFLQDILSYNDY